MKHPISKNFPLGKEKKNLITSYLATQLKIELTYSKNHCLKYISKHDNIQTSLKTRPLRASVLGLNM